MESSSKKKERRKEGNKNENQREEGKEGVMEEEKRRTFPAVPFKFFPGHRILFNKCYFLIKGPCITSKLSCSCLYHQVFRTLEGQSKEVLPILSVHGRMRTVAYYSQE